MADFPEGPRTGRQLRPRGEKVVDGADYMRARDLVDPADKQFLGRFKYLKPGTPSIEHYSLGIEWIAYALGHVLGVPVAPTYTEQYNGIPGVLSPFLANAMDWRTFRQNGLTASNFTNVTSLALSAVFDVWIANCDRSDQNLMVQAQPATDSLAEATAHKVWLIDHGQSMLWPPVKYGLKDDGSDLGDAVIENGHTQAERAIRERMLDSPGSKGYWNLLANLTDQERQLLYGKVRNISGETIERAVRAVPGAYMNSDLVRLTIAQLKARRDDVEALTEQLVA